MTITSFSYYSPDRRRTADVVLRQYPNPHWEMTFTYTTRRKEVVRVTQFPSRGVAERFARFLTKAKEAK